MSKQVAMKLFAFLFFYCVAVSLAEPCAEDDKNSGTCQGSTPVTRVGAALFQTKMQGNSGSAPHKDQHKSHHKSHHEQGASVKRNPDELMLDYSTRLGFADERVTQLEARSGEGRAHLRTFLDALKVDTDSTIAGLDAGKARISAAEGGLTALAGTVSANSAALMNELTTLNAGFDSLKQQVGHQHSAMLEAPTEKEGEGNPPAPPPPPPPSGDALVSQAAALEGRCDTLEAESGAGRLELKNELDALQTSIDTLESGGAGSLANSIARVDSAYGQMSSLASTVDEQGADLTAGLDEVEHKLQTLSHAMGSGALVQRKASPKQQKQHAGKSLSVQVAASAAYATEDPPALPLSSRITSLETRIGLLEASSDDGRGDLQIQLDTLTDRLATIKEGGFNSLAHTLVRVGAMETEIGSLTAAVALQNTDVTARTVELNGQLEVLSTNLGSS